MKNNSAYLAVIVAALGYFVDAYDLILFSVLRGASLRDLGVPEGELLKVGVSILNLQMSGMLLGGIIWGVFGDRHGRIAVLFGSILLYSLATLASAFIYDVFWYGPLRFIAGVGLAGELGAGITLVSESLSKEKRGIGTTCVAAVGVAGVVVAALIADTVPWRQSYLYGGLMGLVLLALRIGVYESGLFESMSTEVSRGSLIMLVGSKHRVKLYLSCILVGLPIWFVVGILFTFSPELGLDLEITGPVVASKSVLYGYCGFVLGDLSSGLVSQFIRSRKKAIAIFLLLIVLACWHFLGLYGASPEQLYRSALFCGFAGGYWAVFVTTAAEQFGTNLRATVTTTVPNFVRGAVVPMTSLFSLLISSAGPIASAALVGAICFLLALGGLLLMKETFGTDLDFIEE